MPGKPVASAPGSGSTPRQERTHVPAGRQSGRKSRLSFLGLFSLSSLLSCSSASRGQVSPAHICTPPYWVRAPLTQSPCTDIPQNPFNQASGHHWAQRSWHFVKWALTEVQLARASEVQQLRAMPGPQESLSISRCCSLDVCILLRKILPSLSLHLSMILLSWLQHGPRHSLELCASLSIPLGVEGQHLFLPLSLP